MGIATALIAALLGRFFYCLIQATANIPRKALNNGERMNSGGLQAWVKPWVKLQSDDLDSSVMMRLVVCYVVRRVWLKYVLFCRAGQRSRMVMAVV